MLAHRRALLLNTRKTLEGLYGTVPAGAAARGPLVKGFLFAQDRQFPGGGPNGSNQRCDFQFNPSTMRFKRDVQYGNVNPPGVDIPTTYFVRANPDSVEFTLLFERKTFESGAELERNRSQGCLPDINALLALTYSSSSLRPGSDSTSFHPRRPPRCAFVLGKHFVLPVYVTMVEVTYQEWNANMVPIRASAEVTLVAQGHQPLMGAFMETMDQWANTHQEQSVTTPGSSELLKAGNFTRGLT